MTMYIKQILLGSVSVIGLFLAFGSVNTIDSGEVGVAVVTGKVDAKPMYEGMHFTSPFTTDVTVFSTRLKANEFTTQAYTKDVQQTSIKATVSYSLNGDAAPSLYRVAGSNPVGVLLHDITYDTIKNVVGRWEAVPMIENRGKVVDDIKATLEARLKSRMTERGVPSDALVINTVAISDISFSGEFERAVEAKVKATQEAEKAKNETVRIAEEAQQKIIAAKAEAESMEIRTRALATNKALIEYEAVQKWDGKMPQYMLGSNTMPFINLNK